ncbi:MAG: 2Fe-2S iron-sulfur cluster-binding protein [Bacteroidia bacterium]|nr:2Fe-2S iron-sulfur cluster-binding protein [Bacteroidia bacterium]
MNITIDNRKITVAKATTVLEVAQQNDIYIPSLCAHPELTPYGGCRLCIVEIEGMRGYPAACTTKVEEGMIVRTDTRTLQEMRSDVVQLILSEHPSACLMCGDIEGCKRFQETIRKVGITTGCRWCPKDKDCEFQRIVESLGINELTLPGLYRDIPVEKYDPFFDRDYNLCIYCDRCVRICHEFRRSSILSLRQRGKLTSIGPAFEDTHIEAGCEFCGACVSVCPTGAMSEKSRKWWGTPDKYEKSVCLLCSLNCEIQTLILRDKIIGTIPPGKPHESGGELCVKGRFCLSELVNRTDRILEPQFLYPEGYGIVNWDFAVEKASEIIRNVPPGRSAVFVSPDLTLEELASVKQFTTHVLKGGEISSSHIDEKLVAYINMAKSSIKLEEIRNADVIFSAFLNGIYNFAPLTIAVKSAAANGVPYYQLGWITDTTTRFAKKKFEPKPDGETKYLDNIISCIETGKTDNPDISELCDTLKKSKYPVFIVGPQILSLSKFSSILGKLNRLIQLVNGRLFMPNQFGNLSGLLSVLKVSLMEELNRKIEKGDIDLLYLVGDVPFTTKPNVKHVICQTAFPARAGLMPDVILPVTVWGETGGSVLNADGNIRKFPQVAKEQGYALSNQEIFTRITKKLNIDNVLFSDDSLMPIISKAQKMNTPEIQPAAANEGEPYRKDDRFPYVLIRETTPHQYFNLDLSAGIPAFGELAKTDFVTLNPRDARKLGLNEGDTVVVNSPGNEEKFKISIRKSISNGFAYLPLSNGRGDFGNNPCFVNIRRDNV